MIYPRQQDLEPPISASDSSVNSTRVSLWKASISAAPDVGRGAGGTLTADQNRAILITALSASCVSLLAVLITLRWFLIMRRSFRHRLVLHLILSDTFKAIWYFVFAIMVFARGPVESTSNFCQASGFFLALSVESADMAILIIALHSILYIVRPHSAVGEGGLYPYRYYIYPLWLGPPLLAASLAFIRHDGYVTAGTFCYLPKRPFWYRLALSWVPRYLIISLIIIMYVWIYVYVRIKFRGFDNLGDPDSSSGLDSSRKKSTLSTSDDVERKGSVPVSAPSGPSGSFPNENGSLRPVTSSQQLQPWDEVNFITSKSLQSAIPETVAEVDEGNLTARGSVWTGDTGDVEIPPNARIPSTGMAAPSEVSSSSPLHGLERPPATPSPRKGSETTPTDSLSKPTRITSKDYGDPLKQTRLAIQKQLRYLFIYPLVYIIMWSFPFAAHALSYNDYFVMHPVFWLSVVQVLMLALQAGVDSVLFSWTEKPWRRIDPSSRYSIPMLHRQSKILLHRRAGHAQRQSRSAPEPTKFTPEPAAHRNPHWWEAEGRRRNDSVWLGSSTMPDSLSPVVTRVRSASPEKPEIPRRSMPSRRRSGGQDSLIDSRMAPAAGSGRNALTPVSSNSSARRPRPSSQSVRPSSIEEAPPKGGVPDGG